jgi:protein involved in ribonucleotide reduction
MPLDLIYFSSVSENTTRLVGKVRSTLPELRVERLPLRAADPAIIAERPYLLMTPTYGGGSEGGAVPKQVIRFLNVLPNRELLAGVISCGNTNFGAAFCVAGDIISAKTGAPHLARIELFGTPEDVQRVAGLLI